MATYLLSWMEFQVSINLNYNWISWTTQFLVRYKYLPHIIFIYHCFNSLHSNFSLQVFKNSSSLVHLYLSYNKLTSYLNPYWAPKNFFQALGLPSIILEHPFIHFFQVNIDYWLWISPTIVLLKAFHPGYGISMFSILTCHTII